ncbi:flagellar basal-body rod protein FlgG [candidate division KSB1 bacterium]|nr:flagellar basal-body rod protein FlgG [candidate division KSB1 bacterium]
MSKVLRTAATGMLAQQLFIDIIANNLANVNTTGFKRSKIEFQDLLYQTIRAAGSSNLQGSFVPTELQVGSGTRMVASQKIFSQGDTVATNNPLDVAIVGNGFFQINKPDGTFAYTRDGAFKINELGQLVTSDGFSLEPQITIPQGALGFEIGDDGTVGAVIQNQETVQNLGQLQIIQFINPAGLRNLGQNLFESTFASGAPIPGNPGVNGAGTIKQRFLESSNVDIVEEMVNMIVAQRAFETNSKAVQAADDMLNTSNQLRR